MRCSAPSAQEQTKTGYDPTRYCRAAIDTRSAQRVAATPRRPTPLNRWLLRLRRAVAALLDASTLQRHADAMLLRYCCAA